MRVSQFLVTLEMDRQPTVPSVAHNLEYFNQALLPNLANQLSVLVNGVK